MRMREDFLLGDLEGIKIDGSIVHYVGVLQDLQGFACHVRGIKVIA